MKLEFQKRKRGKKSLYTRLSVQLENFIYHLSRGKTIFESWDVAKKTI